MKFEQAKDLLIQLSNSTNSQKTSAEIVVVTRLDIAQELKLIREAIEHKNKK